MFRNRILSVLLCLCAVLSLVGAALAAEVDCDGIYCFQSEDFSEDAALTGICITGLPDAETGTVLLGSRVLRPGDILTAEQVEQMTFRPLRSEEDRQAQVTYLPIYADRVEAATTMSIAVHGKEDKAPVAQDSLLETYKNLPNEATLKVSDPEGEKLTYTVARQPKRGTVSVREDGTFTYTPKKNKVGTDSFVYTATDPAGNVSREATVTVRILKPTEGGQYADTLGSSCRFAAEWMKHTGLFVGEQVGGTSCFQPDKVVSRGEFMTMLIKTLNVPAEAEASHTGFTDEAPDWLKPYLAAALRAGITENWPGEEVFGANEPITEAEAALLLQNALDLTVSTVAGKDDSTDAPAWVQTAIATLAENGIALEAEGTLTRGRAAELLYQVSAMAQEAPTAHIYRQ